MKELTAVLENYVPCCEQEEKDREVMLAFLKTGTHQLDRTNEALHFTASSWIVNPKRNAVLMIYHNIYRSWAWTGGHADGEADLLSVALREAQEETGIVHIRPLSTSPFSIETLTVPGHIKRGKYVPSHLHLNVTYLLEADDSDAIRIKADENSGVKWVPYDEVLTVVSEPWMIERVYGKLMEKLGVWKEE